MAKVLVVDDHAPNRELIVTLLKYAGHEWFEAADGNVALEKVRAVHPDLVICDILMPTMDGYEFVRQLRADPAIAATQVIFYSATFLEKEARSLAQACGVSQVLMKPCEPEEVLVAVASALAAATPVEAPTPDEQTFDREHRRLLADKLVQKAEQLDRANRRLEALTDLNLQLASERDPDALLEKVCRGARDLIGARYAVLGVRDTAHPVLTRVTTSGLADLDAGRVRQLRIDVGAPRQVMLERTPRRFFNPGGDPLAVGLSGDYPPVHSGLIAPIVSLKQAYGWIFLIDKLGAESFSEEDEKLLTIHAAQAGRIYENGSLYREVTRTAEQLQLEIVERRHAAEELRIANETLEQRVRLRTAQLQEIIEGLESFNRSVSHDLRGPIGGIAGAARMARDFLAANKSEKADHLMLAIANQAGVTQKVLEALLVLARTSGADLRIQRVDTSALLVAVIESMQQAGAGGPLPIRVGRLAEVEADPELARQVFVNLIGNAIKFASKAPQPQVEVGMTEAPEGPAFFVRDNGVGFDAEQAQRLFQPFRRLHSSAFEGSGVGLSIVKRIIDRHGGRIWADGAPGKGATFYFTFSGTAPPEASP
jgi:signal transduction histidine kinase/CheY-like chemotaxis protein